MVNSVDMFWLAGGAIDFDLRSYHPHLPGYYLYVKLLSILNTLGFTFKSGASIISVSAQLLAAVLFFKGNISNISVNKNLILSILLFVNPAVWYYGLVGETYSLDILAACGFIYLYNKPNIMLLAMPWLAFMSGFRPSLGLLLLPVLLITLYKSHKPNFTKVEWLASLFTSLSIGLLWLIPLLADAGGILEYLELYSTHSPHNYFGVLNNVINFLSFAVWWVIPVAIGSLLLLKHLRLKLPKGHSFLLKAVFLPLLFFIFYHYSKGYILLVLPFIYLIFNELSVKSLFSILVVSFTVFFFSPSKIPPVEINMNKNYRKAGSITNTYARLISLTNTTYPALLMKQQVFANYHSLFNGLIANGLFMKEGKIFFDRSNYVYYGEIAYFYPTIKCCKLDLNPDDISYSYITNWHESSEALTISDVDSSIFVGRSGYITEYLKDKVTVILTVGDLTAYRVNDRMQNQYIELNYQYHTSFSFKESLIPFM